MLCLALHTGREETGMQRNNLVGYASRIGMALSVTAICVSVASAVIQNRRLSAFEQQQSYVDPLAVRAALLQDPTMLVDAGKELRARAMADRAAADRSLVDAARDDLSKPTRGVLGNPMGKHLVVEFFDYQCSHCRDAEVQLAAAVRLDPEMRIVLREIPVLGPGSDIAARAALAAARQGLYTKMRTALMTAPVPMIQQTVDAAATGIGADLDRLHKDMASNDVTQEMDANISLSRRVGVTGTPAFAVPGRGLLEGFGGVKDFVAFVNGTSHP